LSVTEFESLLSGGRPLCLVHIPKTAGSTFVEHFRSQASPQATFWYSAAQREAFLTAAGAGDDNATRICGGHFAIHDFLQHRETDPVFLSFVRHPVDRLVSYYLFARRSGAGHEAAAAAEALDLYCFLQYLERHRPRILFNQQCRFLSPARELAMSMGVRFAEVEAAWGSVSLFLAAMTSCDDVIRRVSVVALGRRVTSLQKRKVTRERPAGLPDERSRQYILDANAEDLKLYQAAGIYRRVEQ